MKIKWGFVLTLLALSVPVCMNSVATAQNIAPDKKITPGSIVFSENTNPGAPATRLGIERNVDKKNLEVSEKILDVKIQAIYEALDTYKWFMIASVLLLAAAGFLLTKELAAHKINLRIDHARNKAAMSNELNSRIENLENKVQSIERGRANKTETIQDKGAENGSQPQTMAQEYLWRGYQAVAAGKYEQAVEAYKQAIELNPDSARAYNNLGNLHYRLGEYSQAIETYQAAVEINPGYAEAYNNLGVVYSKTGKNGPAFNAYEKAIELNPAYAVAYNNLGNVCGKLGESKTAIEAYEKAVELKPDYAVAYYNLGNAYYNIGKDREALTACKKAVELKPDFAEAYYGLACIYSGMADMENSLKCLELAVEKGWTDLRRIERCGKLDIIKNTARYKGLINQLTAKAAGPMTPTTSDKNKSNLNEAGGQGVERIKQSLRNAQAAIDDLINDTER